MNRNTRDVQVDVHPRVVSKYVACRPNARHKMTDIEKGDLFDEAEERLRVCQGELTTTRQQVAVLEQKLVDNVQTQVHLSLYDLFSKFIESNFILSNLDNKFSLLIFIFKNKNCLLKHIVSFF